MVRLKTQPILTRVDNNRHAQLIFLLDHMGASNASLVDGMSIPYPRRRIAVFAQDANNKRIVGYLVAGGDVDTKLEQIALTKVTHLNLAFENPINDDGDLSFHPNNAKVIAHCKRIGIPVLISICGGSASEKESMRLRYFQLIDKTHRSHFVKKLVDYVETHQIDGLDIDLEGPAINEDYDAFIAELAVPLHQKGKLLTCALSQGYGGARVGDATLQLFDFVNVMAYDAAGPWNPRCPDNIHRSSLPKAALDIGWAADCQNPSWSWGFLFMDMVLGKTFPMVATPMPKL